MTKAFQTQLSAAKPTLRAGVKEALEKVGKPAPFVELPRHVQTQVE